MELNGTFLHVLLSNIIEDKMEDLSTRLIEQAARGSMEAFEKIYKVTSLFVYNVAFRITNNTEDAEEVTQDVFIKVYRNLKNFRFQASLKTWMYRITVNTTMNACKKISKDKGRRADYDIAVKTQYVSGSQEKAIERKENEHAIAALLGTLNSDQRACIVLREIEGLNYKEIADALKTNINTVRSRLKRARQALSAHRKGEVVKNEL